MWLFLTARLPFLSKLRSSKKNRWKLSFEGASRSTRFSHVPENSERPPSHCNNLRDVSHFSTSFQSEEHNSYLVKSCREDRRDFSFPRPTKILQGGGSLYRLPFFGSPTFGELRRQSQPMQNLGMAIQIHSIVAPRTAEPNSKASLETTNN